MFIFISVRFGSVCLRGFSHRIKVANHTDFGLNRLQHKSRKLTAIGDSPSRQNKWHRMQKVNSRYKLYKCPLAPGCNFRIAWNERKENTFNRGKNFVLVEIWFSMRDMLAKLTKSMTINQSWIMQIHFNFNILIEIVTPRRSNGIPHIPHFMTFQVIADVCSSIRLSDCSAL